MAPLVGLNPLYHLIAIVRDPMLGKAPSLEHRVVVLAITAIGWALVARLMSKYRTASCTGSSPRRIDSWPKLS